MKELVGVDKGVSRSAQQVAHLIGRRVDYVQENVRTVQKQLDAAEKKLRSVVDVAEPILEDEQGLPLTEIREELDEEDNVIKSTLSNPGRAGPEIMDALRKAGLKDLDEKPASEKETLGDESSADKGKQASASTEDVEMIDADAPGSASALPLRPKQEASTQQRPGKKSVSFAPDSETSNEPAPFPPAARTARNAVSRNSDIARGMFYNGDRVIELDEYDREIGSTPIIPQDESPEDAALRREMLEYSLSEVGAVVAEIDLDEGSYSDEDYDDDEEYDYEQDEDEEDEDQFGRSTRREVSDEYRQKMLELEKKLNARMIENLGPRPEGHPLQDYVEDVRRLVVRNDETSTAAEALPTQEEKATKEDKPAKRGVRFAESLDVSPAPQPPKAAAQPVERKAPAKPAVSKEIVERSSAPATAREPASKPAKISRFKSARSAATSGKADNTEATPSAAAPMPSKPFQGLAHLAGTESKPRFTPEGPEGRILADTVVEHDVAENEVEAPDEDGLDPALLQQELATEYHKMRNKFIMKQGGFMPTPEEAEDPLMEEIDGKVKKVSRFKAARLKASGI